MQNAINRAWNSNDTETLLNCYTAHINPDRGMPTIKGVHLLLRGKDYGWTLMFDKLLDKI